MRHWRSRPLGDLCEFKSGLWKGKKPPFVRVGVIRNTNFARQGALDYSDVQYLDVELKKFENRRLRYGDIILEKSGGGPKQPVGRVALFDKREGDFSFSNFTSTLRVHDSNELDFHFLHKFLYWQHLSGVTEGMQSHSTGIRNLDGDAYKAIEVPLPGISEQQRIVRILDEALAGIASAKANAEKNLEGARTLFISRLQSEFARRAYERKTISQIAHHSLGKMLDKAKNRGVRRRYLRNLNVRWFTFDLSDLLEMPFLAEESSKYTAVKGDVLVCEGGYPGRAAVWNEDYPIHFQKALHRVRFHEPERGRWFVYYLFALDASGELRRFFSGTGIQHFTGEALARFQIPVPPLVELRNMIAAFDELSVETGRLVAIYQRKLAALGELKRTFLREVFSGEFERR